MPDKKQVDDKVAQATDFLMSMRGQYIISQALWKAIEIMRTDEYPEISNIKDMEFLRKNLFNMYDEGFHTTDEKMLEIFNRENS